MIGMMINFRLVEITTKDQVIHQGVYYEPTHKGKRALVWVHGLTSNFYSHIPLLEQFATMCEEQGWGFVSCNNRGHDMIAGLRKRDEQNPKGYTHMMGGAGYEVFEQCIYDIDAAITYAAQQGYTDVVLIGHSTGANKVCFYAGTKSDPRVSGVALLSPASDRLDPSADKKTREWQLSMMEVYLADGKADNLFLDYFFFPLTPRRFLSLFRANSTEDTFDYGDENPKLTCYRSITLPLFVMFGSADENVDRPLTDVINVFNAHQQSRLYSSHLIPDGLHSYNSKEHEVVHTLLQWLTQF